ncbi:hypothetical protein EW14_1751 [Prochlorococcus sp. MIT 0604]|nr:hypothetical protein EW14_1751 [Prochlorococcus sp. MIT 0604]
MHQLWNKLIAPKNQRKLLLGILNLPIEKNNIIYKINLKNNYFPKGKFGRLFKKY